MHARHVFVSIAVGLGLLLAVALLVGPGPGMARAASPALPAAAVITGPVFLAKTAPSGFGPSCTQVHPCRFITEVAAVVSEQRSTIYVAKGRYYGDGVAAHAVVSITAGSFDVAVLGGWNGAPTGPIVRDPAANETILDGRGLQRVIYVGNSAQPTIDGFTITGGRAAGGYPDNQGGGIYVDLGAPSISHCVITGNTASNVGGGIYSGVGFPIIRSSSILSNYAENGGAGIYAHGGMVGVYDSLISGNRARGDGNGYGAGVATYNSYVTLQRDRIVGNYGSSNCQLDRDAGASFGGIDDSLIAGTSQAVNVYGFRLQLVHNTIVNSSLAVCASFSATVVLTDNVIAGTSTPAQASFGGTLAGTNNLFWDYGSLTWQGTNPVFGDPCFANPAAGDYRLAPGSAADDRGVVVPYITLDLAGHPRRMGQAPDIGAYELFKFKLPLLLR